MLIKIPDNYVTVTELLGKHGIPYSVVEIKQRDNLMNQLEILHAAEIVDATTVDTNALLENALDFVDEKIAANSYLLKDLFNEALIQSYRKLNEER